MQVQGWGLLLQCQSGHSTRHAAAPNRGRRGRRSSLRALLAGDSNARVGSLSDNVPLPGGSNDGQRGYTNQTTNAHGKALIKFCQRTGLALCTGRIRGDERGKPTFKRRETTQPSRLDHLPATPAAFDQLSSSSVDGKQEDHSTGR